MNEYYNYQLKLYYILKMYFERLFMILDVIMQYMTDLKIFSLNTRKYDLTSGGGKILTTFINDINSSYNSVSSDLSGIIYTLNTAPNNTISDVDYQNINIIISNAINTYTDLTNQLIQFDTQNGSKLSDINNQCSDLTAKGIQYNNIFPNLDINNIPTNCGAIIDT